MPTMPPGPASAPGAARVAAVDLGATSGRVMVAEVGPDVFRLTEAHRFRTPSVRRDGQLSLDFEALWAQVAEGLRRAAATGPINSVGIDSWGVDYGLLGADGALLGDPVSYRDDRTEHVPERVWRRLPRDELYAATGVAHQRFNTVFQLAAEPVERLGRARTLLLLPDLLSHRLTGGIGAEVTNASTTGLFDVRRRDWCWPVIDALGFPRRLFPPVVEPGGVIGELTAEAGAATGLGPGTTVVAVGSHDTASAIAAVPAQRPDFAYISSGTWSLVGLELGRPVLTQASRAANFANELGVRGTVRYLKNVIGLWLLSECQRQWEADGQEARLGPLLAGAAALPPGEARFDAADPRFLSPGDMPRRIAEAVAEAGGRLPRGQRETVRCVIDSLAAAYRDAIVAGSRLGGQPVGRVHLVGGGSLNAPLCQATADATGLPVLAGPTEASVIGNALVQAQAIGAIDGRADAALAGPRALVAEHFPATTYQPGGAAAQPTQKEQP
ncbi:MAG: rhamnulokinase [Bifidobacteriaceae bacterium]|jgi:rhamnulokinase|nr:rhamnulokinase [Bifidobacteriaceae bacterium]